MMEYMQIAINNLILNKTQTRDRVAEWDPHVYFFIDLYLSYIIDLVSFIIL